jgi:hypothetical protein
MFSMSYVVHTFSMCQYDSGTVANPAIKEGVLNQKSYVSPMFSMSYVVPLTIKPDSEY